MTEDPMSIPGRRRRYASRPMLLLAALLVLVLAWQWRDLPGDALSAWMGLRPLRAVKTWHYQLDAVEVDALARRDADMLVVDYAREGGKLPLTREDVARLQRKPDGTRRLVIAYLSIGEAEEFRFYWQPGWKVTPPVWLVRENCAWPKAWMVRFWDPGWRELMFAGRDAYLARILDAGFDGVYLDRVDMWENTADLKPDTRAAMIDFVADLAATARRRVPGFLVIAQNAEDLLEDQRYLRIVDAVAKEELFFSRSNTGARNAAGDIAAALGHLGRLRWRFKPVFPVEYLLDAAEIAKANIEERRLGLVPVFPTRALDGGDPTAPVALADAIGTPEFIKDKCPPGTAW